MNSFKKKDKKSKKSRKKKDKKHKKQKRRRKSSSSSSSSSDSTSSDSSSSSSSSDDRHKRKKHKKHQKSKLKVEKVGESSQTAPIPSAPSAQDSEDDFSIPIDLMDNKAKAPETKEEYEKRQSVVRKVIDPETGRSRMIKGSGEILEYPISSKERYREIQKQATKTDGEVYESKTLGWALANKK